VAETRTGVPQRVKVWSASDVRKIHTTTNEVGVHTVVQLLREAEVDQLDVTLCIKKNIFGLQISICYTLTAM